MAIIYKNGSIVDEDELEEEFLKLDLHIQQIVYNIYINANQLGVHTDGNIGDFDSITKIKIFDRKSATNDCLLTIYRFKTKYEFQAEYTDNTTYISSDGNNNQFIQVSITDIERYDSVIQELYDQFLIYRNFRKEAVAQLFSYLSRY